MHRPVISGVLVLAFVGQSKGAAGDPAAKCFRGLSPGDAFSARIEYANMWLENSISTVRVARPRVGRPAGAGPRGSGMIVRLGDAGGRTTVATAGARVGSAGAPVKGASPAATARGRAGAPSVPAGTGASASSGARGGPGGSVAAGRPGVRDGASFQSSGRRQGSQTSGTTPATSASARAGSSGGLRMQAFARGSTVRPLGREPLFVWMTLRGEVVDRLRFRVVPEVHRIHYFDSLGTRWTVTTSRRGSAAAWALRRADGLLRKLGDTSNGRLEREMLEEELLGLAILCLDGAPIDIEFDAPKGCPYLTRFDRVLEGVMPASFRGAIEHLLIRFISDAFCRVIAPIPPSIHARVTFDRGGIAYRVQRVFSRGERLSIAIAGQGSQSWSGTTFSEKLVCDARTGLVLEGSFVAEQDALRRGIARQGRTLWHSVLEDYRPGSGDAEAP